MGGAERYVLELARQMARVVPTSLVTFGDADREERLDALRIRTIGSPWLVRGERSNPLSLKLLPEIRKADIVHCHQQHIVSSSLAAAVSRLSGRRVFVTDLGGGGLDVSALVSTDRWYCGHLHISEYSRAVAGHANRPWARVVLGGVDTARFSPDPATPRDGTMLFVGRLLPHKGVNYFIQALDSDMRAEVIGPAPDAPYLQDLKILARGKHVRFLHCCDDRALVEAYRRAACVVLPSVYRDLYGHETKVPELLGQTLLEAMACGTPGVCSNVASLPEVVEHGVTGLVVRPNDPGALRAALRRIRGEPDEAAAMGRVARQRVLDRFSWNEVVRRCLEAYGVGANN